jgi:hypothetical protein
MTSCSKIKQNLTLTLSQGHVQSGQLEGLVSPSMKIIHEEMAKIKSFQMAIGGRQFQHDNSNSSNFFTVSKPA